MLEYPNNRENVAHILAEIENEINKTAKAPQALVFDGHEVFTDYDNYFLDNIDSIKKVEVRLVSYQQMVQDMLLAGANYLSQTPQQIEALAEEFYKSPADREWHSLGDLLEGLDWIFRTFDAIQMEPRLDKIVNAHKDWINYSAEVDELKALLPDFEEAIVNKDSIMLADILSYEIKPRFATMADSLGNLAGTGE